MATWREVENYLSSTYKVEKIDSAIIKLIFDLGNGRSQLVFVEGLALDDPEDAIISVFSPFAKVNEISPQQLVNAMSSNSAIGVAIIGDWYTLKNVAPLQNLDANEIEWPLLFVTNFADQLEQSLGLGDDL